MALFRRPIIWAVWVLASTCFAVVRFMPELTARMPPPKASAAEAGQPKAGLSVLPVTIVPDSHGHHRTFAVSNGRRFQVLVDTGASLVVLTEMDASNIGFRPTREAFDVELNTANGKVRGARYRIPSLSVGTITLTNIDAVVLPREALGTSLLGQSFLRRLGGYEVKGGQLLLRG